MTDTHNRPKNLKCSRVHEGFQNSIRRLYPLLHSDGPFSGTTARVPDRSQSAVDGQSREHDVRVDGAAFVSRYFPRTIKIPVRLRDRSLEELPGKHKLSARLTHVLRRWGARVLGDLHGRRVGEFAWQRNCGVKTLEELDSLASVFANQSSPHNCRTTTAAAAVGTAFAVPKSVCGLRFDELPITRRLANVVRSNGLWTLGDLDGRARLELLHYRACGWRTVFDIQQVIERAVSGEFDAARIDGSAAPAGLLPLLEEGIARLAPRDRRLLLHRLEGMTFAEIAQRYGLTRARVHQVVVKALGILRKTWGPRIPRLLEMIRARCFSMPNGSRLTPALLENWIGNASKRLRLSREAHVRLIAALDNTISASLD